MNGKKKSGLPNSVGSAPHLVKRLNDCLPKEPPHSSAEERIRLIMTRMSAIQALLAYHVKWFEEQTGEDITETVIDLLRENVKDLG